MRKSRLTRPLVLVPFFENLTTSTPALKDSSLIQFLSLSNADVELEVPSGLCASGHKLSFRVKTQNLSIDSEIEVTGKAREINKLEDNRCHLIIQLNNPDDPDIQIIIAEFQALQESSSKLFHEMKGVE